MAACASLDADVLCLQEVDRDLSRSGHEDQAGAVARAVGAVSWRFEPALMGEPGAVWRAATGADDERGGAGYGVAIVSRLPVERWHVVRMPAARVRAPVAVPGGRGPRFIVLPDEPRIALAAEVPGDGRPLVLATTHLSFVPGWNALQLRRLTATLAGLGHPCLLLGDLNLPGPWPALVSGWRALARMRTFPADQPSWQLDHALAFGAVPEVMAISTRRLPLSDHRALVVALAGEG